MTLIIISYLAAHTQEEVLAKLSTSTGSTPTVIATNASKQKVLCEKPCIYLHCIYCHAYMCVCVCVCVCVLYTVYAKVY